MSDHILFLLILCLEQSIKHKMKMHARPMAIALGALSSVACGVRRGFSIGHLGLPGGLTAQRAPSACNRGAGLGVLAGGGGRRGVQGPDYGKYGRYGRFGFRSNYGKLRKIWVSDRYRNAQPSLARLCLPPSHQGAVGLYGPLSSAAS